MESRYVLVCLALLVTAQCACASVLRNNVDAEELIPEKSTPWTPKDMSLEEWRATWGQGYEQHMNVRAQLDYFAYLSAKQHHPDINPESVRWERDDIVYTLEQVEHMINRLKARQERSVGWDLNKYPHLAWPNPVAYKIDDMFSAEERSFLQFGLAEWERLTCVRFDQHPLQEDMGSRPHVLITRFEDGCYATVGNSESYPQILHMADSCFSTWGTGAHEMAHTLGVYHEQSRPDRDEHVTINWDNIEPGKEHNFEMKDPEDVYFDSPYDYSAIMHYTAYGFAVNDNIPTIIPNEDTLLRTMGQRTQITFNDAIWMNDMYCNDSCAAAAPTTCENGGYPDPNNCAACVCKDGWMGDFCEEMQDGHDACNPLSGVITLDSETTAVCVNTPYWNGTDEGRFQEGDECTWTIEAPVGCTVDLWSGGDGWLRGSTACWHWGELRYNSGHDTVGHRVCTDDFVTYDVNNKLVSDRENVVVLFRSPTIGDEREDSYYRGFQFCFEISDSACLATNKLVVEPVDVVVPEGTEE